MVLAGASGERPFRFRMILAKKGRAYLNGLQKELGEKMPIYPYQCQDCDHQFDVFTRVVEIREEVCPNCNSSNTKRLLTTFLANPVERRRLTAQEKISQAKQKGDLSLAAKEAEKSGREPWLCELYREGKL